MHEPPFDVDIGGVGASISSILCVYAEKVK